MIKYCKALFQKKKEERAYRIYVTDMLMAIVNSTGKYTAEERFFDYIQKSGRKKQEKTAEEIVNDVVMRAGLTFGGT